ncbi:chemotaxis protein CheA [Aquimonas voraii]|uniref:Chemotaxis protein CheA n=1 Tax=Aquimonas voraii TaxID=265719 RepID=A0A1G6W6X2_9GAMM|nr:chemotaxis protein CheA [Aquimonas voraii]SDD61558.1 two-component system, chemotaxis family, sensor kinase CheA [Aquimonas voraii]
MSGHDDIAADFLVEASEIAERLGDELVQLEMQPQDTNLLNAIFRGFHTIKGGASFLNFSPLVELCHGVEELFDLLRKGRLAVDGDLFDLAQGALDHLSGQLAALRSGAAAERAPDALLSAIRIAALPDSSPQAAPAAAPAKPAPKPAPAAPPAAAKAGTGESITEDEFEALVDMFQAAQQVPAGKATPLPASPVQAPGARAPAAPPPTAPPASAGPAAKAAPPAESSVRVDTKRLDGLMNLVGELVLARNRLKALRRRTRDEDMERAVSNLDVVTARLQAEVMRVRMQPVGRAFSRFPKVARDVARTLKKEVNVQLIGEETELDKNLVEALSDPLIHLVRNAIDHGIEAPDRRESIGKPRAGTLKLSAQQEGDHIVIIVADDGGGIDPDMLRTKAREKGLIDADTAARLSPTEALQLIFLPGFSTKEQATDISGRGVGMDVVKSKLAELNGQVLIESVRGEGTRFVIRVPLTLAILPTLMVTAAGRPYALPLSNVLEVFKYRESLVRFIDGHEVLDLRQQTFPLVFLRRWLGKPVSTEDAGVVVVQTQSRKLGIVVDQVRGREEVVVKPLPHSLRGLTGLAAATITGDGNLALILDVAGLQNAV